MSFLIEGCYCLRVSFSGYLVDTLAVYKTCANPDIRGDLSSLCGQVSITKKLIYHCTLPECQ